MPVEVTMAVSSLMVRLKVMSGSFLVREKVEILIGVSPLTIFDIIQSKPHISSYSTYHGRTPLVPGGEIAPTRQSPSQWRS